MKKEILKWVIISVSFSFTTLLTIIGYAAWTNITTKTDGATINATVWNELVNNINTIWAKVDTIGNLPTWAIIAFDLTTCPTGWTEYTPARGRFLRWIDPTWTNDSIRTAWNIQTDAFQWHQHELGWESGGVNNIVAFQDTNTDATYWVVGSSYRGDVYIYVRNPTTDWVNGTPRTANETRPKNIAVLYCVKQ